MPDVRRARPQLTHTAKPPARGSKPAALPHRPKRCALPGGRSSSGLSDTEWKKKESAPVRPREAYTCACSLSALFLRRSKATNGGPLPGRQIEGRRTLFLGPIGSSLSARFQHLFRQRTTRASNQRLGSWSDPPNCSKKARAVGGSKKHQR
jgi:hypothetical protein